MKAGLEVHQQLATSKLFCECPAELSEGVTATFARRLRATGGEDRVVDRAAAARAARGLTYRYEATATSCLVEADEEPPHRLNPAAVDIALSMALLLNARPLDEVEVMRKIVVDGSNTSGFQRTALVAVDGWIEVGGKRITIPSICLEEDAARKVAETADGVTYRLDRLGIALIEIATGPQITSGSEAREVAEEIGGLLRSTGKVRRGIGTIREDVNVSIEGGARVEIKGVQELRRIQRYVDGEVARQTTLLGTRDRLRERHAQVPTAAPVDVSDIVRPAATGPIAHILKGGGVVLGTGLPGFAGLLKPPSASETDERLGRELADRARAVGLRGLLHSDEIPQHGIDGPVVEALRRALGATGELDAFVLVAAPDPSLAGTAIAHIRERARVAIDGVPEETRDPLPDGRTRFSRPLPGRARMYPETDVPPVPMEAEHLEHLRRRLPERPEAVRSRLVRTYAISLEAARQIQRNGDLPTFEALVARGRTAANVARLLTQELPAVEASPDGGEAEFAPIDVLDRMLSRVEAGEIGKEAIPPILQALSQGARSFEEALARTGLAGITSEELQRLAAAVVERNLGLLQGRGEEAFSPLMGDLMREVRGRRDGREVADALRRAIAARRGRGPP
jgi:glutamyl-tRNA(Gln) amidotransferase subunit E